MEELIPENPLDCWEHPHFRLAQEHLLSRMREIPLKDRPLLTPPQKSLWRNAGPNNVYPHLHPLPRSEQEGAMVIGLQMCLATGVMEEDDPQERMNRRKEIVRFNLQPLRTKEIFRQLDDAEKAAVIRYVYAERNEELRGTYRKALLYGASLMPVQARIDRLQNAYQNVLAGILGW